GGDDGTGAASSPLPMGSWRRTKGNPTAVLIDCDRGGSSRNREILRLREAVLNGQSAQERYDARVVPQGCARVLVHDETVGTHHVRGRDIIGVEDRRNLAVSQNEERQLPPVRLDELPDVLPV